MSPARIAVAALLLLASSPRAAVWQWSAPVPDKPDSRAFLWIPPGCRQVRAVVVAQNNMLEQSILEHPTFRRTLADLGIAQVWVAPPFDGVFRFDRGAGERFDRLMRTLADASGYAELARAPVIPLGHSACASYPWNFAAWNPGRTLAILSIHGDAPLTDRTGSGQPNPDWGDRRIDGVPGLMAMGEYEWADDRLEPALAFRARHPQAALALLAEPANGHYNASDDLVAYLAMFIRKAAAARLPADPPLDRPAVLRPVDPAAGWLVERGRRNQPRKNPPAPAAKYAGDPAQAFWALDEEMARATHDFLAHQVGKKPQLLSLTEPGGEPRSGEPVTPRFVPAADGITFRLETAFRDRVPGDAKTNTNAARWTDLPAGRPLGHATGGGPIRVSKIVGPVAILAPDTFQLRLDRNSGSADGRNLDVWLWAHHPGDATYKGMVQQASVRIARNDDGAAQTITFPEIPDQTAGTASLPLRATSSAGLPVHYYVREGPAEIDGTTLRLTPIPPRAKFPVEVTVVAWQWGRPADPKVRTAAPVERTFRIRDGGAVTRDS